jgi:hypothetical protein
MLDRTRAAMIAHAVGWSSRKSKKAGYAALFGLFLLTVTVSFISSFMRECSGFMSLPNPSSPPASDEQGPPRVDIAAMSDASRTPKLGCQWSATRRSGASLAEALWCDYGRIHVADVWVEGDLVHSEIRETPELGLGHKTGIWPMTGDAGFRECRAMVNDTLR